MYGFFTVTPWLWIFPFPNDSRWASPDVASAHWALLLAPAARVPNWESQLLSGLQISAVPLERLTSVWMYEP